MLKSCKGSDCSADGVQQPVQWYTKDKVYDVGPSLAKSFVEHQKVAKKAPLSKDTSTKKEKDKKQEEK